MYRIPTIMGSSGTTGKNSQREALLLPRNAATLTKVLAKTTSAVWERRSEEAIRNLFTQARTSVRAYKKFVQETSVGQRGITVNAILPMSKANYLRKYPWEALLKKNALQHESLVLTATSGSTGKPFYIPRDDALHERSVVFHQLFLERSGLPKNKKTLVVVCFGMGAWIGGLLTYEAFRRISERGNALTVITPGVNKREIFDAIQNVGHLYEQLVLCGYPPFVKDVLDEGATLGIRWKQWDMRIVCAAEAFSEQFRNYVMQKTGMRDPYRSVMNIYGSAELGTMATETPLTILLRRLALSHKRLYQKLFSEAHRLPTLAQFIPDFVTFDAGTGGELYATGDGIMPFVRYDIGDQGGVFSYDSVVAWCTEASIDLREELRKANITDTVTKLPFVYLYERADLSTKLYGAIIYPEHVKGALLRKELSSRITGRFTLSTETDKNQDEYLLVHIELATKATPDAQLEKAIIDRITQTLSESSGEYKNNLASMGARVMPRIQFWPYEHSAHFATGIKQKWVLRNNLENK